MNSTTFEIIQMVLLLLAVPALLFVLVRSRRRDAQDIDVKSAERLKSTYPMQIPAENRSTVKKNWVLPVCLAFLGVHFVLGGVSQGILLLLADKLEGTKWYESGEIFIVTSLADTGVYTVYL